MDKHTLFFWSRASAMPEHTCKLEQSKENVVFKDVKYINPRVQTSNDFISDPPFKQFYWGLIDIHKTARILCKQFDMFGHQCPFNSVFHTHGHEC